MMGKDNAAFVYESVPSIIKVSMLESEGELLLLNTSEFAKNDKVIIPIIKV
ncbi:hypothetical protein [Priestia megaterium]|jgi:hypothetical protein|uniref:hypothetical protein n=1 Tax=Priestia megaterium TaxID=1404 RepID=UPI002E21F240|nr:hypothetical protein [Priestia megaterium]MED4289492.1 hypothetical protein [Priestia megaterium]